ncbi:hypothetical protein F8C76_00370 [Flagellimonas olearia]|uniref:Uncharacterized protein n=1 Tax=Flagellimonas olearia TaxID=552546 RepID=A0A6I1E8G2_9FLAO|nr:hypothetical protein [Allomuricauda olearia]KAB7530014.1 hypothetical protein F8C76_00370 [Allomuricauda olearia]
MERISRDTVALFIELKKELTELDLGENEKLRFTYCEIGQLLTHGFSVSLTTSDNNFLRVKNWNTKFYREGFENGFFNLDRLAINEKKIKITDSEFLDLQKLINKELNKNKIDGIVLDGLFCQLTVGNKTLEWNINKEMNKNLNELILLIRKKASVQQRL